MKKASDNRSARYYWAYGSNLSIAQMRRRCPRAVKVRRMFARSVRLAFRGGADVDVIVNRPDLICPGGLWRITAECEKELDRCEGVSNGTYARWFFDAEIDGKTESVLFYKKISNGLMAPRDAYYRTILDGYKDFNLDPKYLKKARERAVKYNRRKEKVNVKLFVYGTLKRGEHNSHRLEGATYLGHAVTEDCYDMISSGFPMIWDNANGRPVRGEIYQINRTILDSCDALEGHPYFYRRQLRHFVSDDGQKHEAWIYVTNPSHRTRRNGQSEIEPNEHGELEWKLELEWRRQEEEENNA